MAKRSSASNHPILARACGLLTLAALTLASGFSATAYANTSHAGWPAITGMLLMNKSDQSRPLDARTGHDPFDGTDPSYACNGRQKSTGCIPAFWWHCRSHATKTLLPPRVLPDGALTSRVRHRACHKGLGLVAIIAPNGAHNELLGGHGNNAIYAGPNGDVIWGDFKPSGDPTTQINHLYGGPGNDIIYAAHGSNFIHTGGGSDIIHASYGRGRIYCESATVHIYISHISRPHYKLPGCRRISYV